MSGGDTQVQEQIAMDEQTRRGGVMTDVEIIRHFIALARNELGVVRCDAARDALGRVLADIERLREELAANARMLARQCDLAREAETVVERLRAIVDCLPRTADGVPILPGMDLWLHDDHPRGPRCVYVEQVNCRKCIALSSIYCDFHGINDGPWLPTDLYSTREAADAAERSG